MDTARHFIPKTYLFKIIDGMQTTKYNVFHWHITDSESFPLWLPSFPKLAENGAYSKNQIYYPTDINEIIEYARIRAIRVIPEIDMPGHADSWAYTFPDLVSCWNTNNIGAPVG